MPAPLSLRIFLSSPGDVAAERRLARDILLALPRQPLLRGKIVIDPVSWDDPDAPAPMVAAMTPQDAVNRGLPKPSQCDLTIVILWGRMGTPLAEPKKPDGRPYLSGTEWEYEDAYVAGKDVLVYRRTAIVQTDLRDPDIVEKQRQQKLVDQFFERFRKPDGTLAGGYTTYATPEEFAIRIRQDVESLVGRLIDSSAERSRQTTTGAETSKPPDTYTPALTRPADATPGLPIHGFVSAIDWQAERQALLVGCVVLEDPDAARDTIRAARDNFLHDAHLRDVPGAAALHRRPFDYEKDDAEVRFRLIDVVARLAFEAYVWHGTVGEGRTPDDLFRDLAAGLLQDRLASERSRRFEIVLDRRSESRLELVKKAVRRSVRDIRRSNKRGVEEPTVGIADAMEPCIALAHYLCFIVRRRFEGRDPLEKRAFERLHPAKIRVIHEIGTKRFFTDKDPYR